MKKNYFLTTLIFAALLCASPFSTICNKNNNSTDKTARVFLGAAKLLTGLFVTSKSLLYCATVWNEDNFAIPMRTAKFDYLIEPVRIGVTLGTLLSTALAFYGAKDLYELGLEPYDNESKPEASKKSKK